MDTIASFLMNRLQNMGVKHCFGVPGDYILDFYDLVNQNKKIKMVNTTSEATAALAADAYARINGIGCVVVTYCVGGLNIVNAIGGAFAEKSPVVVISGSPGIKERSQDLLLHHMVSTFECQHEIFEKITCANTVLRNHSMAAYEIDRVLDACKYYRQPVYIELPRDMVNQVVNYDPWAVGTPPSTATTDPLILEEALAEAVHWLNTAENPVILAGVEVARYGFGKELTKFAETYNIPIATTILGKSVVNEHSPMALGVYCAGISSDRVNRVIDNADCILMLGVLMTDMNFGFMPSKILKRNVVLSTCSDLQLRNHSYKKVTFPDFFQALMSAKIERRSKPVKIEKKVAEWTAEGSKKITSDRLFQKLNAVLDKHTDMAIVADIGDSLFGAADITVAAHHFLSPAFYTSMGFAVPGAVGVQCANSKIRPIVIVGDGAFQMTGMEISTIAKLGLNPIIFVLNNGGYLTERLIKDGSYNDIMPWNYHQAFDMIGGGGFGVKVETEGELDAAVQRALESEKASILNIILDKKDASSGLKRMIKTFTSK